MISRSVVFAVLVLAAAPLARAQSSYRLIDLGIGEAMAINESGSVAGFQWISNAPYPFIWDSAKGLRPYPMPAGWTGTPYSVNIYGEAAGAVCVPTDVHQHAAVFTEAGVMDLNDCLSPTDKAAWSLLYNASAINDEGDVVGWGLMTTDDPNGSGHAWLMNIRTNPATIVAINRPGYGGTGPNGMNQACLIVGENGNPTDTFTMTEAGVFTSLGLRYARAVNETGDVAGRAPVSATNLQAAFRAANGTITNIGSLSAGWSTSDGLNTPSNGFPTTVVGHSSMKTGDQHGFRWQVGGKVTDLTTLVRNLPNRKWYVRVGSAVNGSGWIVGQAGDGTTSSTGSNNHAIVLIP